MMQPNGLGRGSGLRLAAAETNIPVSLPLPGCGEHLSSRPSDGVRSAPQAARQKR